MIDLQQRQLSSFVLVHLRVLVGQDVICDLPKPVLSLITSYGIFLTRERITLNCRCQCPLTINSYYRDQRIIRDLQPQSGKCETSFDFTGEKYNAGSYTCRCLHVSNGKWKYSVLSDPVQIGIGDELLEPTINEDLDSRAVSNGENVEISCKGDIRSTGGTFYLYKNRKENPVQFRNVSGDEGTVTFIINAMGKGSGGNYSCRYQTEVTGRRMASPFSNDVMITEKDAPKSSLLKVGLRCMALIIVLIIAALILFLIIRRGRIRKQKNDREAAAGGVTIYEDIDNMHDTANPSHQSDTKDVYSEVPEKDGQELIYATLNMKALNQEEEAAPVTTGDTSIYAELKKQEYCSAACG
ncbi:immunoglobulin superfamily member 1-like isoform X2 [Heterodontus francisci]|uniref:immunoglobulin superfamily member 1-like isoform X2 n=1 Tax=Heterodontus francisci TaxID=7792 RepID=UPI00355B1184